MLIRDMWALFQFGEEITVSKRARNTYQSRVQQFRYANIRWQATTAVFRQFFQHKTNS